MKGARSRYSAWLPRWRPVPPTSRTANCCSGLQPPKVTKARALRNAPPACTQLTLNKAIQTLRVPVGSVFGINGASACIATGTFDNPHVVPVRIITSELGASLVQPSSGGGEGVDRVLIECAWVPCAARERGEVNVMRLVVHDLGHRFPGTDLLFEHLDFSVEPGTTAAICGPSGCGKSTLLSILAGWEKPYAGSVEREGIARTGWVFQNPVGVAQRTALDHVVFPLLAKGHTGGRHNRRH